MRIMFAVPCYWPSQDGVTIITSYLAQGLAAKGHDVLVVTSAGNGGLQELPEEAEHEGVRITRMRIYTRWPLVIRGRDRKSTKKEYFKHVREYKPDVLVVVCSQTWTLDWLIPHLKELDCVKVFYSHGYSAWKESYSYIEQMKKRNIIGAWSDYKCMRYYQKLHRYIRLFDRAIYLSEESNAAAYAEKYGLKNGRILKNAIDDRFFTDHTERAYKEKECIRYLFVANYNQNKNQEMLIRAFGAAKIGKSRLILVGFEENAYYDYLKQMIREELAEQKDKEVQFYTHVSREKVIDLYRSSDVFVCSSQYETYSIVAHEAAAARMPIISTNVGIYSRIKGAYMINDWMQMQKAMEELYYNAEEREERGKAAYEWVCGQECRIEDKVDWFEHDLAAMAERKLSLDR
ncbi:MAG: glycosyltransferase family 4 protein [Ruminococcus flavefaciens]|nr:glycosyltransferase family 4 protein [Ruminococcus flavefaciens]